MALILNKRKLFKFSLSIFRNLSFLTTPIFYVNAKPHIGHLYTALIADSLSRFEQLKSNSSISFMTGTDEHGLKIHQAAKLQGLPELSYCDHVSKMYCDLFTIFRINYTDFLRTTETRHKQCVTYLWDKLKKEGYIYPGEYSGWYCVADECFVPESDLIEANGNKLTADGHKPVDFVSESNYKFKLSLFRDNLLTWLKKEDRVRPSKFQKILTDWIEEGSVLEDISVSRPRKRVPWGIPVPNDETQTIYVWLDALSCYLTTQGYPGKLTSWPPCLQIIGKDILKFHGVYWPAFLIGAGLEPPRQILCHSHWLVNGEKMSKSKGNVVDPLEKANEYSAEGFRYFLLREGAPHSDGNFSDIKIKRILNSELADTLGNLLNRCCGSLVNPDQCFPEFDGEGIDLYCKFDILQSVKELPEIVERHFENYEIYKAIDAIMATLRVTNEFFERKKPWELRKLPGEKRHLNCVLYTAMNSLRVCGILLTPVVPELASKLLDKLQINDRSFDATKKVYIGKSNLNEKKIILFSRMR